MEERVKMLRGKFELETAANKGVKLTFSIPV
jgi:signal transduction histidine kinase